MRRLPPWVVFFLGVLTVGLIVVGYEERHHIGPIPLILGLLWGLFTLAAAGAMFKPETE